MGRKTIAEEKPELLKEWDYRKNKDICIPEDVTAGSHLKVWWKCENGHEWMKSITNQIKYNFCPICRKNSRMKKE
ncbi:MAG: zinc-ribbon domain-containing protein [Erysipelotrichales bacterium]|nr:zinc-ribbon domain-containing protein [Erysipelotrichales bacterium]